MKNTEKMGVIAYQEMLVKRWAKAREKNDFPREEFQELLDDLNLQLWNQHRDWDKAYRLRIVYSLGWQLEADFVILGKDNAIAEYIGKLRGTKKAQTFNDKFFKR